MVEERRRRREGGGGGGRRGEQRRKRERELREVAALLLRLGFLLGFFRGCLNLWGLGWDK